MLKIGLTGNIGAGKSTVSKVFAAMGVPVFDADIHGRQILSTNLEVQKQIIALLGDEVYDGNQPNRALIASKVFKNDSLLKSLNAIVHPAVGKAYDAWLAHQKSDMVIREAAILIEAGTYKDLDYIVLVTCPEEERVRRVMKRDQISEEQVRERIRKQMPEEEKKKWAKFEIVNDGSHLVVPQVLEVYQKMKSRSL